MNQKARALEACQLKLQTQQHNLLQQMAQLNEALETEGKSSVGDKHETSRARIQSEIEKIGEQLKLCEQYLNELAKLSLTTSDLVQKGSFVKTNHGLFFIGAPLGKVQAEALDFFAISAASPIGKLMMGKTKQSTFELNGTSYRIEEIQ